LRSEVVAEETKLLLEKKKDISLVRLGYKRKKLYSSELETTGKRTLSTLSNSTLTTGVTDTSSALVLYEHQPQNAYQQQNQPQNSYQQQNHPQNSYQQENQKKNWTFELC
jgi:hypothetical protein